MDDTSFPAAALLANEDLSGLEVVTFLPGSGVEGLFCGLEVDPAAARATRLFAKSATDRFAEGGFVTQQLVVLPTEDAKDLMRDATNACARTEHDVVNEVEPLSGVGDEAILVRYSLLPAGDISAWSGHFVLFRRGNVVCRLSDTWDDRGGLGRERVVELASKADRKLQEKSAARGS
ncbi:MAG: hypothetical protein HY873_13010 [Chloroflexi bacterium]|nr:hypothetical protein [Chloroflexota bacterium]